MFTTTMTNAEIRQEAKKDFLELSGKIRMALERFGKRNCNLSLNSGLAINDVPRSLITQTVERRQWVTRQRTTWHSYFRFVNPLGGSRELTCQSFVYTPVHRETGTEYIFLNSVNRLFVERFSLHFIERYKERHLAPRAIDTKGLPLALHFQLYNQGLFPGTYYKNSAVGVEDGGNHRFWIAPEGIVVTDYIDDMLTYITFMDREDLSPLKAQVYEEEKVWRHIKTATDDTYSKAEQERSLTTLIAMPDFGEIFQRFAQRNLVDDEDGTKQDTIDLLRRTLDSMKSKMPGARKEGERRDSELLRRYRTTDTLYLNQLRKQLDIKSYHLPPGAKEAEEEKERELKRKWGVED